MRFVLILLLPCFFQAMVSAQEQTYFQQKVDHNISVYLDTDNNELKGQSLIQYSNNSRDTLTELVFHLWMNAFGDRRSEFARQMLDYGQRDFHFTDDENLGYYKSIEFRAEGQPMDFEYANMGGRKNKEIVYLKLDKALPPNSKALITVDYNIKLPYAFDRPGFKGELYRITQWYPKPAVYDAGGWHPMSYLSLGEFYSEFGDYNVEINVPLSFSIASTGSQIEDRSSLDLENRRRTIFVEAEKVHDFAWFASDSYLPFQESLELEDRSIDIQLFVKETNTNWQQAFELAKRALSFFSEELMTYPYPQLSIVESGDDDGSGMEYPMITILDMAQGKQALDHLIAHELAHQWFYGILASNERDNAWIDEGLASFYDDKYEKRYYEQSEEDKMINEALGGVNKRSYQLPLKAVLHLQRTGFHKSIADSSRDADVLNYLASNYVAAPEGYQYLEAYLGEDKFKEHMQRLFRQKAFRHLSAYELESHFENASRQSLDWFFRDFLHSERVYDIAIKRIKGQDLKLRRNGNFSYPSRISLFNSLDNEIMSLWIESNTQNKQSVELPLESFDHVVIDEGISLLDIRPGNNRIDRRKRFPALRSLNLLESEDTPAIGFTLGFMYNHYDRFMLGPALYNSVFPQAGFRYQILPAYAFGSRDIMGLMQLEKDLFIARTSSALRKISLGLNAQRFSYFEYFEEDLPLKYYKINPVLTFHFARDMFHYSSLDYQWHHIGQDRLQFDDVDFQAFVTGQQFNVHQLNFRWHSQSGLSQTNGHIQMQYEKYGQPFEENNEYLRTTLELRNRRYYNPGSQFFFRFFAGYFPINSRRNSSSYASLFTRGSLALAGQGFNDQVYEDFYFARNGTSQSRSTQIHERHGGFKTAFGAAQTIGMSNDLMMACNLKTDLPWSSGAFRLRPYLDMAATRSRQLNSDPLEMQFLYSAGISLEIGELAGIYLPVLQSSGLNQAYESRNLFSRLSFKLDMKAMRLKELSDHPGRIVEFF